MTVTCSRRFTSMRAFAVLLTLICVPRTSLVLAADHDGPVPLSAEFWGQIVAIAALVICSGIVAGTLSIAVMIPTLLNIKGHWPHPDVFIRADTRIGNAKDGCASYKPTFSKMFSLHIVDVPRCDQFGNSVGRRHCQTKETCCTDHADTEERTLAPDSAAVDEYGFERDASHSMRWTIWQRHDDKNRSMRSQ